MRNILTKIKDSIYGPKYYRELIKEPFSYSFKYLLVFGLLFALLVLIKSSVLFLPKFNEILSKIGPTIIESYPAELEVNVKSGNVSTNVTEPYFIKTPSAIKENARGITQNQTENLITIDTKSEPNVKNLEKFNTAILITENYVIFKDNNNKITSQSIKGLPDFVVNQNTVSQVTKKITPYFKILLPILGVFIFIGAFLGVLLNMIYLLFIALLVWLIAVIKKAEIGYGKSYQFSMHLMTLPILLSLIPYSVPYQYSLLLLILAALNINKKAGIFG